MLQFVHTMSPIVFGLALCVLLEELVPHRPVQMRDRFPGAIYILMYPILGIYLTQPLQNLLTACGFPPLISLAGLSPFLALPIYLLMIDFCNYWGHRLEHRFTWPFHAIHHSVEDLHAANGYTHPFQLIAQFISITVPMSFVEVGQAQYILAAASLLIAFQSMVTHSPIRFRSGPLRRVWVDSHFHRVHHSLERQHWDRNFGTMFTIWDQMFGTAYFPKATEWPDVGLEGVATPRSLSAYLLRPFRDLLPDRLRTGGNYGSQPCASSDQICVEKGSTSPVRPFGPGTPSENRFPY